MKRGIPTGFKIIVTGYWRGFGCCDVLIKRQDESDHGRYRLLIKDKQFAIGNFDDLVLNGKWFLSVPQLVEYLINIIFNKES